MAWERNSFDRKTIRQKTIDRKHKPYKPYSKLYCSQPCCSILKLLVLNCLTAVVPNRTCEKDRDRNGKIVKPITE